MGKVVGAILQVVSMAVFTAIGMAVGGPPGAAIGAALGSQVGGLLSGLVMPNPKPEQGSTAIKTPRPPRVSAYGTCRLFGAYILYETSSNGAAVDGYAVHHGMMAAPVAYYLNDDVVTHKSGVSYPGGLLNGLDDGRYGDDTSYLYWTDGRTPGTTIPEVESRLPGIWTGNHRGDGVVLLYSIFAAVKAKNFLKRYPNGAPSASIVAQWQKCPDLHAEDPTDESGWTWTENVIRQLAHYMLVREGVDYATKIAPSLAFWQAAQDVCDEAIPLKAGGSEARYRSCLAHKHTDSHGSVKASFLELCDGWMATRPDGSYAVYAGKYYAPTVSIDGSHIVSFDWQGVGVDDDSAINTLVCSYVSAAHDYNSVETTPWIDEDDIAERGAELSENLDMQTPSWGQVRRLAKRKIARTNAPFRGTITTNVAGRIARGHRYINLKIEEAGATFFDGVAEITAVTRNVATGGLTFSWVAADPNIDAWNPATEEGDPAAVGDRVALAPLETPVIDTATAEVASDNTSAQVRLTVAAPDREDLTWYVRWKVSTDSAWNEAEYSDIDPGASVELLTGTVPLTASLDIEVAYGVGDGRVSDWSATVTVDTTGGDIVYDGGDATTEV